jgi:antitoxin HigA-1
MTRGLHNITPGEILRDQYLKPLRMSQYALADALGVPRIRVSEIIRGRRSISPDTAIRLGIYFRTGAEFWMRMQAECDLRSARRLLEKKIRKQVSPCPSLAKAA